MGKDGSGNWKDEATFQKYRTAELKHGRVAMLATTGILTAMSGNSRLGRRP